MTSLSLCLATCLAVGSWLQDRAGEAEPVTSVGPNENKRRRLLEIDEKLRNSTNGFYGDLALPSMREQRRKLPANPSLDAIWDVDLAIADRLLCAGEVDEATRVLNRLAEAFQAEASRSSPSASPSRVVQLIKKLVVASFRRAERENCICDRGAESCIFPLAESARHTQRSGAEAAVRLLNRALEIDPRDLHCVWLLNLAHMALGSYPEGVPGLYRIPPERFDSDFDIGRFQDVAPRLGITRRSCAGGAILDDFDGDGDLDVILSSMEPSTPMAYHRNRGDGTFVDVTAETGLDAQLGGLNFVHGDIDGDGRLDLYVPRGAWMGRDGEIPHSLLRQQPDGTFLDVTTPAGLDLAAPSQVAAFADVDNDGDLDLFVGCESVAAGQRDWKYPSRLYRNDGKGRFENATETAGVGNLSFCKGAAFGDYDGDGWIDLYVSNLGGPNRLYQNKGGGSFVDRAVELGVADPIESFATWWFDANNDGWLDLLVTSYDSRDRSVYVAAYYKHGCTGLDSARVYLNLGGKGFRDATIEMGLDRPFFPMGCNFGDFDNDGFPDMYFGTGEPDFGSLWPNLALRNDRGRRFQDVTTSAGLGHLQKGHGVAFGDIDQDGDQDLLVEMGGAFRDDAFYSALFVNPGHGHHWLTVRLEGVDSNRFGVGARLRVRIEEPDGERDVFTWVGSGGSFGGNSLQAEIGLKDARRIVELEVRWPRGGRIERFEKVPLDSTVAITEGAGGFRVVPTRPIKL